MEFNIDRTLQLRHRKGDLNGLWVSVRQEYPESSCKAVHILLHFATTYECESAFSSLIHTKSKQRYEMQSIEQERQFPYLLLFVESKHLSLQSDLTYVVHRVNKFCEEIARALGMLFRLLNMEKVK